MAQDDALQRGANHLDYIDALRGWAFLAVLAVHTQAFARLPEPWDRLSAAANYGVQLFFVVSALTLFMSFDARRSRDVNPVGAFFVRRFFRIAPLFWLAIFVYAGVAHATRAGDAPAFWEIAVTFLFMHGWHPVSINSVVPGGWSISVEMNFYLLLPICFAYLNSLRRCLVAGAVLFALSVGVSVVARSALLASMPGQTDLIERFQYYWLPREMPVFVIGMALFFAIRLVNGWRAQNPSRSGARFFTLLPYGAVALLLVMSLVSKRLPLAYFAFSCGFGLLALALSQHAPRFLLNRAVMYVGTVSFSAYITHFMVLRVVGPAFASTLKRILPEAWLFVPFYVLCMLATVLVSTVTYRLVEVPGQNLGKRLIARLGYGGSPRAPNAVPAAVPAVEITDPPRISAGDP